MPAKRMTRKRAEEKPELSESEKKTKRKEGSNKAA
jgi:hypothetical protein